MTLDEFSTNWLGKEADFDNFADGQCVDLVRYFIRDVLKYPQPYPSMTYPKKGRGAADFWENFDTVPSLREYYQKMPNTSDFIPQEGDIAIFNRNKGGGHGHICIVVKENHDLTHFYSFDQNWTKISFCEIVKHTYIDLYGVLRPKKYINDDEKDMPELDPIYLYLGIGNYEEARERLADHLGEVKVKKDGVDYIKCNWGAEGKNGGYLGSAREKLNNPPSQPIDDSNDELSKARKMFVEMKITGGKKSVGEDGKDSYSFTSEPKL